MHPNISINLPTGRQAKLRLLRYSTSKMNMLFFSSLHFTKIIKALLYPKKYLAGYITLPGNKKAAWRNVLIVGNI